MQGPLMSGMGSGGAISAWRRFCYLTQLQSEVRAVVKAQLFPAGKIAFCHSSLVFTSTHQALMQVFLNISKCKGRLCFVQQVVPWLAGAYACRSNCVSCALHCVPVHLSVLIWRVQLCSMQM